ncbi:acyltransferase [Cellulomonas humilata]|uniref:Acyltransferase n=1 Tax=Cellulomonas humilata TaxID=144055 RepID=A0A7Y6DX41_9CELL|nr:acyltransferase [Cellulomonas humilata]
MDVASAPAATETVRRAPFRPDIEGLRAIAVALVVLYHARVPGLGGGYVGVDVFFVISGFLITNHLAAELTRTGRIGFAQFYARRMRRILPASFVVLAVSTVAAALVMPPLRMPEVVKDAIATALYVPNMWFARQGTDYLAETAPSPMQHYWSLGVEEQFYLLWPLLLLVVTLLVKRSRSRLVAALAVVVAGSFALNLVVMTIAPTWAFFSLPTRAWELGVGGLVALLLPQVVGRRFTGSPVVVGVGLLLVLASAVLYDESTAFPGLAAAVPVLGTALAILGGAQGTGALPGTVLRSRPFQYLGRLSYSTYLWHWPLLVIVESRLANKVPLWASLALAAASVPLAALTYRYVEDPMRHLGALTRRPARTTLLAGLAGSVALVVLAVGMGQWSASKPLATSRDAASTGLTAPPAFADDVPANLTPSLRGVDADIPAAYADSCQLEYAASALRDCPYGDLTSDRVVALFGDSHATQWLPALDALGTEQGFRVDLYAKSGCPSADVVQTSDYDAQCAQFRQLVLAHLAENPPELVLLSTSGRQYWRDPATAEAEWRDGLAATLDALPATSTAAIIGTTPNFDGSIPTCLSLHLADAAACADDRDHVIEPERLADEAAVAAEHGALYFPAVDYLCDAETCGAIEGNILLYRDEHHLTTVASLDLADELGAFLFE